MNKETQHLIFDVMVPEMTEIVERWSTREGASIPIILTALGASTAAIVSCLSIPHEEKKRLLSSFCETLKKSLDMQMDKEIKKEGF